MNHATWRLFVRRLATIGCACIAIALAAVNANAAGLGGLTVYSALGQPLSAEIAVNAMDPEEFARVLARIASPDDYQAAKLAYSPFLRQLRVSAERRKDGKMVLKVTSYAPVNEPTLDLLMDFNWRDGRLLQKYSVLLDPPK